MKNILLILSLAASLIFSGCGTLNGNKTESSATLAKVAAYVGTQEALREHPDWRQEFVAANEALAILETQEKIDAATLLAIVNKLPIDELKSDRAVMLITATTILISEFGGDGVQVDKLKNLKPIVTAIREGIELGLQ